MSDGLIWRKLRKKVRNFTVITNKIMLAGVAALWLSMAAGCGNKQVEWEKHVVEETIVIAGIEEEYTLLFLTDTHIVTPDPEANEQQAENETQRAGMFVNAEGISSAEQFSYWVKYANEMQVDAVLLGGDIIDTPSDTNLKWLENQLSQFNMPYLYVNGNHDWTYPWEYMTEVGRETYLPLLEPFMQGNTEIQSLELGELTIIGIDDSTNQVSAGVLPEYERLLAQGKPTIVMCHVPFMTQSALSRAREVWNSPVVIGGENYGGIQPNEDSAQFLELTTGTESPVELMLSGHVHFYDRGVIEEGKGLLQLIGGAGYEGNAILLHIVGE